MLKLIFLGKTFFIFRYFNNFRPQCLYISKTERKMSFFYLSFHRFIYNLTRIINAGVFKYNSGVQSILHIFPYDVQCVQIKCMIYCLNFFFLVYEIYFSTFGTNSFKVYVLNLAFFSLKIIWIVVTYKAVISYVYEYYEQF